MARTQISVALEPAILEGVDAYRLSLPVEISRSKAVEALVKQALKAADKQLPLGLPQVGGKTAK
jgi:hypothetical protein